MDVLYHHWLNYHHVALVSVMFHECCAKTEPNKSDNIYQIIIPSWGRAPSKPYPIRKVLSCHLEVLAEILKRI